jgi:hypothetical protein
VTDKRCKECGRELPAREWPSCEACDLRRAGRDAGAAELRADLLLALRAGESPGDVWRSLAWHHLRYKYGDGLAAAEEETG